MSDLSTASLRRLRIKKALSTITTLRAVASASEWWSCLGVIVDRVFILSYSISITLEARRVFYANIHEWRLCLWILAAKQASRSLPDVTVEFTLSPSLNSFWSLWSKRVPPAHKSLLSKGPEKVKEIPHSLSRVLRSSLKLHPYVYMCSSLGGETVAGR